MSRRTVLITDGEERAALALVRSLGRAGFDVRVCSARGRSLAGASRHARGEATVADPLTAPDVFVDDVLGLVRRWSVDVLIPVSEAALLAILPARRRLGAVRVPFPDEETFRRICDKRLVLAAAPGCGIAAPEQCLLTSREDLARVGVPELWFPVVVKPARSVGESGGRRAKLGVAHAADRAQLEAVLRDLDDAAYPLLLQRRVRGRGVGVFLLLWDGRLIAAFSHRRIREKPPSGGVSVYRESIPLDPELLTRSRALLEHLGWQGVAMVEYKVDDATGTPYLMEINGRFWGSLQLAIDSGVDFPTLLVAAANGEHPAPVLEYRPGVRSRWWWGEVDHLLARLRGSPDGAEARPERSRWRAVRDFLTVWRPGDRNEVLRLRDPWPIVRETIEWLNGR